MCDVMHRWTSHTVVVELELSAKENENPSLTVVSSLTSATAGTDALIVTFSCTVMAVGVGLLKIDSKNITPPATRTVCECRCEGHCDCLGGLFGPSDDAGQRSRGVVNEILGGR